MQNKDEKLLTAVSHWSYRFVSNGVPLSDFNASIDAIYCKIKPEYKKEKNYIIIK